MAVHLVVRTPYARNPSGLTVESSADPDVLAWLQRHWATLDSVEGFWFVEGLERSVVPPRDMDEARSSMEAWAPRLGNHQFPSRLLVEDHAIRLLDSSDIDQWAAFVFDDVWRAAHPGRADFVLLEDWRLPEGHLPAAPTGGDDAGTVWFCRMAAPPLYRVPYLDRLPGPMVFEGMRLDGFVRWLARPHQALDEVLRLLRATLPHRPSGLDRDAAALWERIVADPADDGAWAVLDDWHLEHDRERLHVGLLRRALAFLTCRVVEQHVWRPPGAHVPWGEARGMLHRLEFDPAILSSRSTASEAIAQGSFFRPDWHQGRWTPSYGSFDRWILFDDRWVAANPDLAAGCLRFVSGWDVL